MTRQAADQGESSHQPGRDMDGYEKLTVAAAAAFLGTSQDAVRKKIQRNTIRWTKDDDGRVYVYLDPSETSQAADHDESGTTIEMLREQLSYLQEVIRTRDEEIRRHQHLLAAALERIPAIEAPPDTPSETSQDDRESPVTASENRSNSDTPPEPEQRRSWLHKLFFGPS